MSRRRPLAQLVLRNLIARGRPHASLALQIRISTCPHVLAYTGLAQLPLDLHQLTIILEVEVLI